MKNLEIEKKYLVNTTNLSLEGYQCKKIIQGYIYSDNYTEVRIRSIETHESTKYYYTVKVSGNDPMQRTEIEFQITREEFNTLSQKTLKDTHLIEKDRYLIPLYNDLTAELDIYHNELDGLSTVEVEFTDIEEATNFKEPDWFGVDITSDKSYKNKNLAKTYFEKGKIKKKSIWQHKKNII